MGGAWHNFAYSHLIGGGCRQLKANMVECRREGSREEGGKGGKGNGRGDREEDKRGGKGWDRGEGCRVGGSREGGSIE